MSVFVKAYVDDFVALNVKSVGRVKDAPPSTIVVGNGMTIAASQLQNSESKTWNNIVMEFAKGMENGLVPRIVEMSEQSDVWEFVDPVQMVELCVGENTENRYKLLRMLQEGLELQPCFFHRFVGLCVIFGLVNDIVTTNYDGLIENGVFGYDDNCKGVHIGGFPTRLTMDKVVAVFVRNPERVNYSDTSGALVVPVKHGKVEKNVPQKFARIHKIHGSFPVCNSDAKVCVSYYPFDESVVISQKDYDECLRQMMSSPDNAILWSALSRPTIVVGKSLDVSDVSFLYAMRRCSGKRVKGFEINDDKGNPPFRSSMIVILDREFTESEVVILKTLDAIGLSISEESVKETLDSSNLDLSKHWRHHGIVVGLAELLGKPWEHFIKGFEICPLGPLQEVI